VRARWFVAIALTVGTALTGCKAADRARSADPGTAGGVEEATSRREAANFALRDLDGRTVRLSEFRGKVVLLDFWATWCPPCRKEVPHFKALHSKYASQGLVVVGVALDREGISVVRPFVREHGVSWITVLGDEAVVEAYGGIESIPTTFVVDRDGRVAERMTGYRTQEELEAAIRPLL
jgi:peroxiredoxin